MARNPEPETPVKKMTLPERTSKAQASAEFLIVFAVSVVVLIGVFFLVSQQIISTGIQKENAETQQTVSALSKAVTDVYTQGEGAVQTVHIVLPSTYDAAKSGIINNSLVIKTRETYHVQNFNFPVYGTLPQAAGAYDIVLISRGGSVYVGSSLFRMTPALISTVVAANTNQQQSFTIANLINESITLNGTLSWGHPEMGLTAPNLNFVLNPYDQQEITLGFAASGTSGSYPGTIVFNANSTSINDSQVLGIYAEIPAIIQVINGSRSMNVYPSLWNVTVAKGNSASGSFTECAINTPINSVSVIPTPGRPGSWLDNLAPFPVSMNACTQKGLTITVPQGTRPGTYSGSAVFSGDSIYVSTVQIIAQVTP
ncbi:Uncharacterised protein [uncultured archaeon]|nr:Uncharacterised protein [uncultured archaeon]